MEAVKLVREWTAGLKHAEKFLYRLPVCPVVCIDESNFPLWNRGGQREGDKRSFRKLCLHKAPDDARDADADFREIDEQLHVGHLDDVGEGDLVQQKIALDVLAGKVVFIQQHHGRMFENMGFVHAPQAEIVQVLRRCDKNILHRFHKIKVQMPAVVRLSHKAEVELVCLEHTQRVVCGLADDGDADMGMVVDELL